MNEKEYVKKYRKQLMTDFIHEYDIEFDRYCESKYNGFIKKRQSNN